MKAKEAIKSSLDGNLFVLKMYLADLSDADLLVRPVPGANHVAWQLGHLIAAENKILGDLEGTSFGDWPRSTAKAFSAAKWPNSR